MFVTNIQYWKKDFMKILIDHVNQPCRPRRHHRKMQLCWRCQLLLGVDPPTMLILAKLTPLMMTFVAAALENDHDNSSGTVLRIYVWVELDWMTQTMMNFAGRQSPQNCLYSSEHRYRR